MFLLVAAVPACLPLQFSPEWLFRVGTADGKDVVSPPHGASTRGRGSRVGGIRGSSSSPMEDGGGEQGGGRLLEENPQRKLVSGGTPVPRGEYPFMAEVLFNSVWNEETNSTDLVRSRI